MFVYPLRFAAAALCGVFLVSASSASGQKQADVPVLTSARVAEVAAMLPKEAMGFGPPCRDRSAWKLELPAYAGNILSAERLIEKPLPPWSDARYLEFSRNGTRPDGEAMLRDHNGQLSTLVLAECDEWQGRFLTRIIEEIDAISSQRSWTEPAHDEKLENFNGTRHFVELNSAALGHALAEALYLLGDHVPEGTRKRALAALELHMFAPMRSAIRGGTRESWYYRNSNWNAVCWNGVVGAALTVLPDIKDRALFAAAGALYSAAYLVSYSDSGYAEEGIGYWSYGFSAYEQLREHLWAATAGKIDLYDDPKARKAALFPFQFQMLPDTYADFGDAHFMTTPSKDLMASIDQVFNLGVVKEHEKKAAIHGALPGSILAGFPVMSQRKSEGPSAYDALIGLRTFYADVGVLVSRPAPGGRLGVTIKAGGNAGHSHNDIGAYSIGLDGTQPVGDPGGPAFYNADTFGPHRFDSKLLNSFGHPVPEINGHLQLDATKIEASVLTTSFTPQRDSISIDMSKAYADPSLKGLVRTMRYSRQGAGSVEIEDRFDISAPIEVVESLPTHGTWKVVDRNTLQMDLQKAHLRITVVVPGEFTPFSEAVEDYGVSFTRVGLRLRLDRSASVKVAFAPLP